MADAEYKSAGCDTEDRLVGVWYLLGRAVVIVDLEPGEQQFVYIFSVLDEACHGLEPWHACFLSFIAAFNNGKQQFKPPIRFYLT